MYNFENLKLSYELLLRLCLSKHFGHACMYSNNSKNVPTFVLRKSTDYRGTYCIKFNGNCSLIHITMCMNLLIIYVALDGSPVL